MLDWQHIKTIIDGADRILLTTHENPDGDGLGTATAMGSYLESIQKKDFKIIIPSDLPFEYSFLNQQQQIRRYNPNEDLPWLEFVDLVIIFDVGDFIRLRQLGKDIQSRGIPTMNIDHHPHPEDNPFTYNVVDTGAAATGEMIHEFFISTGITSLTLSMATGIYTAIMTDTGSFRYTNTTAKSHLAAIACMEAGVDTSRIYQQVYENNSRQRVTLLGHILSSLRYELDGEVAWFTIDSDLLKKAGAGPEDVDGFTDYVRSVRGVEVAIMFFGKPDGTCRINFRSKGRYTINQIAKSFGGGGHAFAAGAVVDTPLRETVTNVLKYVSENLPRQKANP
ncbi:MAG: bifunctional oligoribonuclease/PAP phosphatase NrnA [FCB group bacterium]|nr:bifunctional oligoribonuclease/PAP phosphatase NrnA [FCB group bacterium]